MIILDNIANYLKQKVATACWNGSQKDHVKH